MQTAAWVAKFVGYSVRLLLFRQVGKVCLDEAAAFSSTLLSSSDYNFSGKL